jgi:hypothetical protein
MIGQYLSNNNEKNYNVVLQKILELNQPHGDDGLRLDDAQTLTFVKHVYETAGPVVHDSFMAVLACGPAPTSARACSPMRSTIGPASMRPGANVRSSRLAPGTSARAQALPADSRPRTPAASRPSELMLR